MKSKFDGWDEPQMIERIRELAKRGRQNAIDRGLILEQLNLSEKDYEKKNIGIRARYGYILINFATSPRTHRQDIVHPCNWRADYELVKRDMRHPELPCFVPDKIHEEVYRRREGDGFSLVGYDSSPRNVLDAIAAVKKRFHQSPNEDEEVVTAKTRRPAFPFENEIVCGNCLDLISKLKDRSVNLVVTSPPYGDVMKGHYPGVPEPRYVEWFCKVMSAISPKLTRGGSVLVIIRAPQKKGRVSPFVLETRLALQKIGWFEPDEFVWRKPDAPGGTGSNNRLRHGFENILWFAQNKPYIDTKAGGKESDRLGFKSQDPHGVYNNPSTSYEIGTARKLDVFEFCVSEIAKNVKHPAMFPQPLAESLIETFSRPGDVVLDPFMGSGTTALAARALGRNYIGFDIVQKFVDLVNRRLENERR